MQATHNTTQSHITNAFHTKSKSIMVLFEIVFIAFVLLYMSGCNKMGGLDYAKFEELSRQDAKKPKHKRKTSFSKIRAEHIKEHKPKKRKIARRNIEPEFQTRQIQARQAPQVPQYTFTSTYSQPTTNEANEMLLNPLSQAGSFTLPQGLSPYGAEVIEDEMLPFPLVQNAPKKYKPTSHSELVSLVQNESVRLSEIDTSQITDMGFLFACNEAFLTCRQDFRGIEVWNTGRVVNMESMFEGNAFFNADISDWNVSKVRNISKMFHNASKFNRSLNRWGSQLRRDVQKNLVFRGSKLESNPPKWYRR